MSEPDQNEANPYRSPAVSCPATRGDLKVPGAATTQLAGWQRFLFHMLIASFLAPAVGGAALIFSLDIWQDVGLLFRLAWVVIGGLISAIVISPASLVLGLITYPFCILLRNSDGNNAILWGILGSLAGLTFALLIGLVIPFPRSPVFAIGAFVGAATGLLLRWLWTPPSPESPGELDARDTPD